MCIFATAVIVTNITNNMDENMDKLKTKRGAGRKAAQPTGEAQKCQHDLAERETMVADGYCPVCLSAALAAAELQLKSFAKAEKIWHQEREQLEQQLAVERDFSPIAAKCLELEKELAAERDNYTLALQMYQRIQQPLSRLLRLRKKKNSE
jgi:hypothetical protein